MASARAGVLFLSVLAACLVMISAGKTPNPSVHQNTCLNNNRLASMRVSVTTCRNSSGHYNSQIACTLISPEHTIGNWQLDVDHQVVQCGGISLETLVHLTAPPVSPSVSSIGALPTSDCCHAPPSRVIPADYEFFPLLGYYKFHPEALQWPAARKVCEREGAHLFIINSEDENGMARTIYARHPTAGAWFLTGILEFGIHAEWFTLFGVPLYKSGFSRIYPGENNALGPSDFGAMHRDGDYADISITVKLAFICEIDL